MLKLCWLISAALVGGRGNRTQFPKGEHLRTIPLKFSPNRPSSFREEDFENIFAIESYVKDVIIMSVHAGRLSWWTVSSDTILKGDHLRTIPLNFCPNGTPSSFRKEDFLKIFSRGFYVKSMSVDIGRLGWWAGYGT